MEDFIDHIKERICKNGDNSSIQLCEDLSNCPLCIEFLKTNRKQQLINWYITNNNFNSVDVLEIEVELFNDGKLKMISFDDYYEILNEVLSLALKPKSFQFEGKHFFSTFDTIIFENLNKSKSLLSLYVPKIDRKDTIKKKISKSAEYNIKVVNCTVDDFENHITHLERTDIKMYKRLYEQMDAELGIKSEITKYIHLWSAFEMRLMYNKLDCSLWESNRNHLGIKYD